MQTSAPGSESTTRRWMLALFRASCAGSTTPLRLVVLIGFPNFMIHGEFHGQCLQCPKLSPR